MVVKCAERCLGDAKIGFKKRGSGELNKAFGVIQWAWADGGEIRENHSKVVVSLQIMEILPARAEGYPWVSIYNSEKHGFSLASFYR